ncbi:hypothetical protein GGX14DRAFT_367095, partial [Mycena pura]
RLVFRFVFIPWLQHELDAYLNRINNTAKRADKNKILYHSVPNDMFEHPQDYGILDFKIRVAPEHIQTVRELYAPTTHEVFQLVPRFQHHNHRHLWVAWQPASFTQELLGCIPCSVDRPLAA